MGRGEKGQRFDEISLVLVEISLDLMRSLLRSSVRPSCSSFGGENLGLNLLKSCFEGRDPY